ncbi:hypothetical protein [Vibrio sp. 10N.286.48.B7]|uniref:hypothetical protein n=1 Tax=Vibrio sp. 10N.286.48.B7 TaxID=1880853 RepID=UPI0039A41D48
MWCRGFVSRRQLENGQSQRKNPTEFIENIIWYGLKQDLKYKPDRFNAYNGEASFGKVSTGLIEYGLQTKYPCYDQVPQSHRFGGL